MDWEAYCRAADKLGCSCGDETGPCQLHGLRRGGGTYKGVSWYRVGVSWYADLGDGVVGPNERHFRSRAAMQKWISEFCIHRDGKPPAKDLCSQCGGNGVINIPGGMSECPRCDGDCWEPLARKAVSQ